MSSNKDINILEKGLKTFLYACNEAFLKEHVLDEVDINILDNYTDFIVERVEILMNKMKEN